MRQPGSVACLTAVLIHACEVGRYAAESWDYFPDEFPYQKVMALAFNPIDPEVIGRVILLAWCLLALGRQSRPEAGAVERIGRALGIGWIACSFLHDYVSFTI